MKLAVQELVIRAPIDQVFEHLVDPELFVLWMADDATLDPVPGGVVRWTHPNGDSCSGTYVEVVRPTRVVFTYRWERSEVRIPPGSTTVAIDLSSELDGSPTSGWCTAAWRKPRPTPTRAAGATICDACGARPRAKGSVRIPGPIGESRPLRSCPDDRRDRLRSTRPGSGSWPNRCWTMRGWPAPR